MGPESADRVTLEASNANNGELGWKTVAKGKRSKKSVAGNCNEIKKVAKRSPKKLDGSVTRKLVSNGADHIPPKKRRVLRTPSELQSLAVVKEDLVSPQPQTPSPHGDSKPQSKVFCNSSAVSSSVDRVGRACVSGDLDQKLYNPEEFSGIALLAAAAGIDLMDDSGHLEVIEEHSISEKADMSASREPFKCSISIEPESSPSDLVKESTDSTCSSLGKGAAIPQSMQVNEDVAVREFKAPKVNRLHWDLNLEMDAWEQPLDLTDHSPDVEKLQGEGCKVSAKSDYCHIEDNHMPLVQIEQVRLGPANVTDNASVGISALDLCPTKSTNDLAGQKPSSNLGSAVQSHQVPSVYIDKQSVTASENITVVLETEKVTNETTPFTDSKDSTQNIELAVSESSQHDSNINSVVAVVAEETSYLPDNSGNNSSTKEPADFSPTYKVFSTSGASTHSGFYNSEDQANSTFVSDTPVVEGAVLPTLSTKDDGSQSCLLDSNINSVVAAVAEETSHLPENSRTNQPAHFSPTYKDSSALGASTHSDYYNPEGQANSTFVPDTTVIEGDVSSFLSAKDDGSQSCDPTGSSGKIGSSPDDGRCSEGDGSNIVGSKDMTRIQDGNDSPYEDGELRLSMPCPWLETESDYGYNECVDYESDGADYPGSEVVEDGSDGSLGVEKRSISVREAVVPELNSSGSLKSYMNKDVELEGTMDESKVEYFMRDNNLRRRHPFNHSGGIEPPKGSHLLQSNRSRSYSRPTRGGYPHTFMDRQRSHFHVRERNGEDEQWNGQWGSRSNISSGYRGPAGRSYNRPRNMTVESEKFSESNSQDYSSKAAFRVDNRRLPYENDDFYRSRKRTATNNSNRSMGNMGNSTREVSRGNRNDSYDPAQEKNHTRSSNRLPPYLTRPEPSYSPPSARVSRDFIPRKRFRSRSRSRSRSPCGDRRYNRSRSPCGDRRYNRSPEFRSPARVDRVRMPFRKPNFPGDHSGSARGHYSPQSNRRWVDDRNFMENPRHRSSPVRASERIGRFNSVGSELQHKEENYFRPGNRPRRFPPVAGAGRGCNFGDKYDDRRNDIVDTMHRTRYSDANIDVGRCRDDEEDNFDGKITRKDDEHRDVARSSHEDGYF